MKRRAFLAGVWQVPVLLAKKHFPYSHLSVLTDEVGKTPAESIAFARQYGLQWVELRSVPGRRGSYWGLPEQELRDAARELSDNGLKVSFLNTGLLKFTLPGTESVRRRPETPEQHAKRLASDAAQFERRMGDLQKAIDAAHIFGVDRIRVFAFLRTADPKAVYPRVAEIIGEMSRLAGKEKVRLLLENESSCNVATAAEAAAMLELLPPDVGLNWDPHNGLAYKETPFPDGYKLLPRKRIENVQIKAKSLLPEYNELVDWPGIFDALANDGYKGKAGLETHIFDGTLIEASHKCLRELQRILKTS